MTGHDQNGPRNSIQARNDGDPLAPWFAAARRTAPVPSAALMARVLADAHQSARAGARAHPAGGGRLRGRVRLGALAAGVALAALAGIWTGVSAPGPVQTVEALLWGSDPLAALEDDMVWIYTELLASPGDGS